MKKVCLKKLFIVCAVTLCAQAQFLFPTKKVISTDPDDIRYLLFKDPNNMSSFKEVKFGNMSSLLTAGYQKEFDSVTFVVHGFMSAGLKLPYPRITIKAYLKMKPKGNYFLIDWGKLSDPGTPGGIPGSDIPYYDIAVSNTKIVGNRTGEFITFLIRNGMLSSSSRVRMVGHSLGAHLAGFVGKYFTNRGLPRLLRITGLDPAALFFQNLPINSRLSDLDAEFVDTIHTSTGIGYSGDIGHFTIHPNSGGPEQPGCIEDGPDSLGVCAHNIVGDFFTFSIYNSSLKGCKCSPDSPDRCIPSGNCATAPDRETFGEYVRPTARGSYYVTITRVDPSTLK